LGFASSPATDPTPIHVNDAKAAAAACNRFGFDLYAKAKVRDENVILSPLSAAAALAMTAAGARGETLAQMAHVLHVDGLADAHRDFAYLQVSLAGHGEEQPGQLPELAIANRIWGQKGLSYRADFLALLRDQYGASLGQLDFEHAQETARVEINEWVKEQTRGRIPDLLEPGMVDALTTRLVLTNAVYFKGKWQSPFPNIETREQDFRTPKGMAGARMMRQLGYFAHAHLDDVQLVELPYVGGRLSMIVILPDSANGLSDAEGRIGRSYDRWLAALEAKDVDLWLPTWTRRQRLDMANLLAAMGMPLAFTRGADFSGMTDERTLEPWQFYISEVIQKAFVEANETGTEAAAATAVVMAVPVSADPTPPPPPPVVFHADHPFLYLIRDRETGAVLFLGRVVDPR
jgi:serpin B